MMCDFSESPDTESEAAVNHIDLNALQKRRAWRWETRGWRCLGLRAGPGSPPQPLGEKQRCPSSAPVLQLCSASFHGRAVASHPCPPRALMERPSTARCCAEHPFWVSLPSQQLPGSAAGQKAVQGAAFWLWVRVVFVSGLSVLGLLHLLLALGAPLGGRRGTGPGTQATCLHGSLPALSRTWGHASGGRSHSCREAQRRAAACPETSSCRGPGCSRWRLGAGRGDLQRGARCGLTEQKLGAAQSFLPRSPGVSMSTSNHQDGLRRQRLVF